MRRGGSPPRGSKMTLEAAFGFALAVTASVSVPTDEEAGLRDPRLAREHGLFVQARQYLIDCFTTPEHCTAYAQELESGRAVGQGAQVAAVLYEQGWVRGHGFGCYRLALLYADGKGVALDHPRAARLYDRACALGVAAACTNLGVRSRPRRRAV